MMNSSFDINDFPEITAFRNVATRFCSLLENDIDNSVLWARQILDVLAEVYSIGQKLPDLSLLEVSRDTPEEFRVGEHDWKQIFERVSRAIPQRYYWVYFDPILKPDSEQEAVVGDLADDLADIYRDLKSGLSIWENQLGIQVPEIVWNWKFLFQAHWGQHAIDAMRALHQIVHVQAT
jgi:hypothetical protein